MSDSLALGYIVPPTDQDISNAIAYATNKAYKKICDDHPELYTWIGDTVVGYPCPYGLTCSAGNPAFTEKGCRDNSATTYFDCKRSPYECAPHGDTRQCNVCDFNTSDGKFKAPMLNEADLGQAPMCSPGDVLYTKFTSKEADAHDDDEARNKWVCQGKNYDPPPYVVKKMVNGTLVDTPTKCTSDNDCTLSAGGSCMLYENKQATGYCVDPGQGYLEYRDNWTSWDGRTGNSMCVQTQSEFKKWCEMPWTRHGANADDDDLSTSLEKRISLHPETKRHPPFWYDDSSGTCFMTKDYCMRSIPDGGYDSSFGRAHDFNAGLTIFTDCQYPHGHASQIREGYDCCTPLATSALEFFTGKTTFTAIKDVLSGDISPIEFLNITSPETNVIRWIKMISEDALKINKQLIKRDFGGPGIHAYSFEWDMPLVTALYPERTFWKGIRLGLLASELQRAFPTIVEQDHHGNRVFPFVETLFINDAPYRRAYAALLLCDDYFQ